jgi:hypothetical protein
VDHDVNAARDAGERDLVMKMRGRGDGERIDALIDQFVEALEGAAARHFGRPGPVRRRGIDDADQRDIRQTRQHPGMVAAHHAGADHPHAKRPLRLAFHARYGPF